MNRREKRIDTKEVLFKRLNGVKVETFNKMLNILNKEYNKLHKNGGKPPKLTPEDKLRITLKYFRQYPTMDSLADEYKVCKGTICLSIQWVENTLLKNGTFDLPGKRVLKRKSASVKYVVVDVTESPINRPKKGQKEYYSGKKSVIR